MTNPVAALVRSVPLARPDIGDRERQLVGEVLDTDVLAMGPFTRKLELALAERIQRREAVACSSGTAALHMAVRALGLREGDEVLTTSFSFVASTNCLLYERITPRLVDIEDDSLGIDPDALRSALTSRTRAILPVHVFGRPCRIDEVMAFARDHGLVVIEDACEGLGSTLDGKPVGSFADIAAFAFYPNKQITTGEGGAALTDDPDLAETMRSLRNQGRDTDGTWLRHVRLGYNYRMDELSAALGVAQLERLAELRAGRDRVAAAYGAALGSQPWVTLPRVGLRETVDWFVYVIRLSDAVDRDRLIRQLDAVGVPSRPYFAPIHLQPFYREITGQVVDNLPVTERVARGTLALPFSSRHTDEEIAYVSAALIESVQAQGVA